MKTLILLIIITIMYFFLHLFINEVLFLNISLVLMVFILLYLIFIEIKQIWPVIISYFFNIKNYSFDKQIERPRLFFYINFVFISCFMIVLFKNYFLQNKIVNIHSLIFLICFVVSIYMLFFTWTSRFKDQFIIKVQKKLNSKIKYDFKNEMTDDEIKKLFENLDSKNLINNKFFDDNDINNYKSFLEIIKSNKLPEEPQFILNMNCIKMKMFWKVLNKSVNGLTLNDFLIIFENKNKSSRSTIDSSFSKANSYSKNKYKDSINKLFEKG